MESGLPPKGQYKARESSVAVDVLSRQDARVKLVRTRPGFDGKKSIPGERISQLRGTAGCE